MSLNTPSYLIDNIYPKTEEDADEEELLEFIDNKKPFHIGQSYEHCPAKQIGCAKCGSDQFHVAQGSYYTAIRCINCNWELGIHDG